MSNTIKYFSPEDQQAFIAEHELAEPKEWAVMDGSMVYSFYDAIGEAQIALEKLNLEDKIGERFEIWVEDICEEFSVDLTTAREIIKARV